MEKQILCKDCRFFYGKSQIVESNWLEFKEGWLESIEGPKIGKPFPPSCITYNDSCNIKVCQHEDCFTLESRSSPISGQYYVKKRINSHVYMNRNFDCHRFEKKRVSLIRALILTGIVLWVLHELLKGIAG